MSRPRTRRERPSCDNSSTTVSPIGFGRRGDRVANTPWGRLSVGGVPHQTESFGAIEGPDDEQVRKTFDVLQTGFKFLPDFEEAFRLVLRAQSLGNLLSIAVGTSYVSDGLHGEHNTSLAARDEGAHDAAHGPSQEQSGGAEGQLGPEYRAGAVEETGDAEWGDADRPPGERRSARWRTGKNSITPEPPSVSMSRSGWVMAAPAQTAANRKSGAAAGDQQTPRPAPAARGRTANEKIRGG